MYAICLNEKPATLEKLYKHEDRHIHDHNEDKLYLCAPTEKAAKDLYLHHFGFTWKERARGVECYRVVPLHATFND